MYQAKGISEEEMSALSSPYRCIKCGEGVMIPAVQEGEPDYTDNFLCVKCHFHDSIPTNSIIGGQILTGSLGMLICLYLLLDYVFGSKTANSIESLAMGMIVLGFAIGFGYVFFRALSGIKHRKAYMLNRAKTSHT
jgi:hypothetical protein